MDLRTLIYDPPIAASRFAMILSLLPPSNKPPLVERLVVLPDGMVYKDGWKLNGHLVDSAQAESLFLGHITKEFPGCLDEAMQIHYLEEDRPSLVHCVVNVLHLYADKEIS